MKISDLVEDYSEELVKVKEFICGTEYEIEDIKKLFNPDGQQLEPKTLPEGEALWFGDVGYMRDGSLRNNGVEIVTCPTSYGEALHLFEEIHSKYCLVGPEAYTARTSTHVHVNVLPWTTDQLKGFVLLYALLEPYYFYFVPQRKHNIHCVPLNFTTLPIRYNSEIQTLIQIWSKYTAFNLLPVTKQGTVEFRHLEGTGNIYRYKAWLNSIKALWDYVNKDKNFGPKDVLKLLSKSTTSEIAAEVFGMYVVPSEVDFYQSTVDVKLAFI